MTGVERLVHDLLHAIHPSGIDRVTGPMAHIGIPRHRNAATFEALCGDLLDKFLGDERVAPTWSCIGVWAEAGVAVSASSQHHRIAATSRIFRPLRSLSIALHSWGRVGLFGGGGLGGF